MTQATYQNIKWFSNHLLAIDVNEFRTFPSYNDCANLHYFLYVNNAIKLITKDKLNGPHEERQNFGKTDPSLQAIALILVVSPTKLLNRKPK